MMFKISPAFLAAYTLCWHVSAKHFSDVNLSLFYINNFLTGLSLIISRTDVGHSFVANFSYSFRVHYWA